MCRAPRPGIGASDVDADLGGTSLVTLVQMVAGGLGVTLLPDLARVLVDEDAGEVRLVPFRKDGPARTVALVHRPDSPRAEEFRALRGLLRGALLET